VPENGLGEEKTGKELGEGRRQRERRTREVLKGIKSGCRRHRKNLNELLKGRTK